MPKSYTTRCVSLQRRFKTVPGIRADADDLLQETWLRIHKVRHTYRPSEPVLPWFYAIAHQALIAVKDETENGSAVIAP